MKRQIASLQRQVGKAQKYKELRDELRGLDIYVSKQRIHGFDQELEQNAANRRDIEQAINEATGVVVEAERSQQELHAQVRELEERLQTLASQQAAADNAYSRANEVIGVNAQRIEEYTQFADRDERDIADTKAQLEEIAMQAESLQQKTRLLTESLAATKDALAESEEASGITKFKGSSAATRSLTLRFRGFSSTTPRSRATGRTRLGPPGRR